MLFPLGNWVDCYALKTWAICFCGLLEIGHTSNALLCNAIEKWIISRPVEKFFSGYCLTSLFVEFGIIAQGIYARRIASRWQCHPKQSLFYFVSHAVSTLAPMFSDTFQNNGTCSKQDLGLFSTFFKRKKCFFHGVLSNFFQFQCFDVKDSHGTIRETIFDF